MIVDENLNIRFFIVFIFNVRFIEQKLEDFCFFAAAFLVYVKLDF